METLTIPEIMCDEKQNSCSCILIFGHEGPHKCDPNVCGGSWNWEDGKFVVYSLPLTGKLLLGLFDE